MDVKVVGLAHYNVLYVVNTMLFCDLCDVQAIMSMDFKPSATEEKRCVIYSTISYREQTTLRTVARC
jgi:hypothetical protein